MLYTMRPRGSAMLQGLEDFVATLPEGCSMAEIGCYRGEATEVFLRKAAHLLAVDPWSDYVETNSDRSQIPMAGMEIVEKLFDAQILAAHPDQITKIKGRSVEVAATIPDASLDVVYIDANHEYADVVADIQAWRPKVKPGGLLAGHDYEIQRDGVVRAVLEVLGEPDAVFPDATWVQRVPPGPKADGPAPRLSQLRDKAPRVLIGIPSAERGGFRPFEMCLQQLMEGRPETRVFYSTGCLVAGARNRIVREALAIGADYVWFLDDDQPFFAGDPLQPEKKNDLDRLLAHNKDAVIALSCRRSQPFAPLLFSTIHPTEPIGIQRYLFPDDDGLIEVAAAGFAGLLIKTSVFLRMGLDGWFELQHPTDNFDDYSEDFQFYRKLERAGVQLYCDLDVRFGHATTAVAYIVKQQGKWYTAFADSKPFMMAPQPTHPLGIEHAEKQRHKLVLVQ